MKKILISLIIGIIIGAVGTGIIKNANDLNSATLRYNGLVTCEQGKIPFI